MWHYTILFSNTNPVKKTIHSTKKTGTIRIIGGRFRGKILTFPAVEGLRPTSDRIRETLFNWLMHDIQNARCLDAFSGSGALGFEAYSRGATAVVFIESMPQVYRNLQQIARSFNTPNLHVINTSAIDYLQQQPDQSHAYDIIFIDPPFSQPQLFKCIHLLEKSNLLVKSGLLYVESPHEIKLDPALWQTLKLKKTGAVTYALYQKIS
jgi:16S rRNA (guanine966-N2)-methyltransferase